MSYNKHLTFKFTQPLKSQKLKNLGIDLAAVYRHILMKLDIKHIEYEHMQSLIISDVNPK